MVLIIVKAGRGIEDIAEALSGAIVDYDTVEALAPYETIEESDEWARDKLTQAGLAYTMMEVLPYEN